MFVMLPKQVMEIQLLSSTVLIFTFLLNFEVIIIPSIEQDSEALLKYHVATDLK